MVMLTDVIYKYHSVYTFSKGNKNLTTIIFRSIMSDNTQNAATQQEPLLTPDDSRYVMFPIQHNDIWEMYKKSIDSFWHTGEVSLAQDMNDWI